MNVGCSFKEGSMVFEIHKKKVSFNILTLVHFCDFSPFFYLGPFLDFKSILENNFFNYRTQKKDSK